MPKEMKKENTGKRKGGLKRFWQKVEIWQKSVANKYGFFDFGLF